MASNQAERIRREAPPWRSQEPRVEAASWSFMDDQPNIQYDHAFSIANFSQKLKKPIGTVLSSGIFTFMVNDEQTSWTIDCYPNGYFKEDEGYVSIYLAPKENNQVPIKTEFILSIINKDGAKSVSKTSNDTFDDYDSVGAGKFVSHENLQNKI